MLEITDLKTEYQKSPMGIDAVHPRFSWKLKSDKREIMQDAYRILASSDGRIIWDTGVVKSDESQCILYSGEKLESRQRVTWKVEVKAGTEMASSEEAHFEMGLLQKKDWHAEWIEPEDSVDFDEKKPSPYIRKVFQVKEGLKTARIYQSAHGMYEFWLNGKTGTQDKLKPGFTSYYYRCQYQTYDITELLHEGKNVWAVVLGDGWWRGTTGGLYPNNFGYKLHYIGQIELTYLDGTRDIIGTDESFTASTGGLRMSDMRMGDIYDAREEPEGWKDASYDASSWENVHISINPYCTKDVLIPSRSLPVREIKMIEPVVAGTPDGNVLLDFGQNLAGYVKMKLHNCKAGQKILLIHGEEVKDGDVYQGNVAFNGHEDHFQTIEYIAKGGVEELYIPMFAVFGFRYVGLKGYPIEKVQKGDFISCALSTDLEETGKFECSDHLINRLALNALWSQRSNFIDVPTDCPTRERSVWSGDAQIYCKTASDFMNVYPFYEKWMQDWNYEQFADGKMGTCCPSTNCFHNKEEFQRIMDNHLFAFIPPSLSGPTGEGALVDGSAGWGDVSVILPWRMYVCYGDKQILKNQYESGKKWVDYMIRSAKNPNPMYADELQYKTYVDGVCDAEYIWDTGYHWGEWLEPDAAGASDGNFDPIGMIQRGNPIVATAYLAYSSETLSKIATVLGKECDAIYYRQYSKNVKRVYEKYLIQDDGLIVEGKQAPYVRALVMELCSGKKKKYVSEHLLTLIKENGYKLNTGFLTTVFLLPTLADIGAVEEAYKILEQKDTPGWLYNVKKGATTIPENWNGLDNKQDSYNHYSYGAVCDFMFTHIAGIRPDDEYPGYKRFFLQPIPGGTLNYAEASYNSIYGEIYSRWEKLDTGIKFQFSVPVNTMAEIILPNGERHEVGSGNWSYYIEQS